MNFLRSFWLSICALVVYITPSVAQITCPSNINFELGNLTGWNCFTSSNTGTGSYTWSPTASPANNRFRITSSTSATDPYGGFPIVAPGGGTYSLKLGNDGTNKQMEQVRYTFTVPTGQNEFAVIYRYAVVLENPGHPPIQQPFFRVRAYNAVTNATVNCGNFDYVSSSSLPGFVYAGSGVYYKDWATASLNLSGQAGSTITLEFTTSDCSQGAHFGYAYVDMNCGLFAIQNTACNTSAIAPLSAPPGFQSYTWYDSSFSQVLGTGQSITVPNPAQRTLYRVQLVPYPGYGCTDTLSAAIVPAVLNVNAGQDTALCNIPSIQLSPAVTGNAPPFSYSWTANTGASSINCANCGTPTVSPTTLTNYYLTVTDANNCTARDTVSVLPTVSVVPTITPVSCFGGSNGSISITAQNGTAPLAYQWNTPAAQTTTAIGGLSTGSYGITVTDGRGCVTQPTAFVVPQPNLLTATISASQNVSCKGGSNGTATVTASGGTAPYSYSWNTIPARTTATANNLPAGSYTVTVTDAKGCVQTASVNITEPVAALAATATQTPSYCNGVDNGTATVTATGGTSPYTYSWNTVPAQTTAAISGLAAGTYTATVTDANNCTSSVSATIVQVAALTLTTTATDVSCNGGNNGTATITANGGTAPYTYSWNTVIPQITDSASGLSAGNYTVTVTDSNGCISSQAVVIAEPNVLQLAATQTDVLCNGGNNGSATVTASGGTAPYSYSWSTTPTQTTATANNLSAGIYTALVTDAKGCTDTLSATINEPALLTLAISKTDVLCNGGNNGTATVTATGGTAPYAYTWNTTPTQTTATASNLTVGSYTATVVDVNGCTQNIAVTITEPTVLTTSITGTDATCNSLADGTATITVTGGVMPYTYVWSNSQSMATASSLSAGVYSVTITDSNGCTQSDTITLAEPAALTTTTVQTNVSCNSGANGTATVTASGGTAPYAYSWNTTPVQTTTTAGNLTAGSYTATVTDAHGCIQTATITITEPTALTASTTQTNVSCNGGVNGTATVTATGGTTPYAYSWNTTPVQTTASISGLITGSYIATVTDANGCIQTANAIITEPALLTASMAATDVSCNGGSNGTATVTATGGTTPYSYSWNTVPSQTTASISGLIAGTYTTTVTDANGCMQTATATITEPATLAVSTTQTNVSCNGGNNGTATVTASGGTTPYSYSWNSTPAQTSATASGLISGNYIITVTDANGCVDTQNVSITEPSALQLSSVQTDVLCNGGNNGSATVTATGGTTPYSYSWNTTPVTTTAIANGLSAGTYTATVVDGQGCIDTLSVTINQPVALNISVGKTDVSCNAGNNGTATVTTTGGTTPYVYAWNTTPAQTTATATNLSAGTYTITVTDDNGCTQTDTTTITEPAALTATTVQTNVSCNGGANGTATVTATGGTTPYAYSWNTTPTQTTATATNLSAGTYTITVTDANGCIQTATSTIVQPTVLTASTTQTNVSCNGGVNGTATVTAGGGTTPYAYSWNTMPVQTTASISNLTAGSYTATVTDANGCIQTAITTITQPTLLTASVSKTNVSCSGGSNGMAAVTARGGTTPYTYSWNTTPTQTTATANNLTVGAYTITITDANGCIQTANAIITEPALLTASMAATDVSCNGGSNGTATVTATGGTTPYAYSWNTTPAQTTASISSVAAGSYTATVTDANGCIQTATATITQPALLTASVSKTNVSCNGGANGTATVTASGGTTPYAYSWNTMPVQTAASISNLAAGSYTATVTDANGCTQTATATITQPALLTASVSKTNVSCNGGNNGSAAVTASGGTTPYAYSWNTTPVQTTASISGLAAGSYTATVTDANGCIQTAITTITQPTLLTASVSKTNVSCNSGSNGTATVTATGGTTPYTYSWNTMPVQTAASISSLAAGSYTATVTDANGCTQTATATITQPAAIIASIAKTDIPCNGGSNGTATVTATGGTTPYTYSWNTIPVKTTATANNLTAGTYTVTITDANGCTQTTTATITQPALLTASVSKTNVSCNGGNNGSAAVTASGGTTPYAYSWNTTPVQTTASISGLAAGSYTATVTDANGCTQTTTATITQPAALFAIATGNNPKCYGDANGTASVNVNGGTAPYSYSWNTTPVQINATAINLTTGSYTITVTDAQSCTTTAVVSLIQPDSLSLTMTAQDVRCFNGSDGSATVAVTGGTMPYVYEWNGNAALNTASYNRFSAGTQVVRVTDANGCTKTGSAVINSPTPVVAALVVDSIPCFGAATGVVRIANVTGGTGPYEYYWQGSTVPGLALLENLPAGSYTVRILDQPGCTNTFTINLPEHPSQNLFAGKDSLVCAGSSMSIQATGKTTQWQWSPATYLSCSNCSNPIATPAQTTTYILTGTDSFGCIATDSITLTVQQRNPVTVGDSIRLCVGATATLSATGGDRYSWTPTTGLSCSDCPNPSISDTVATNYQVVISQGNCFTDTLHQKVIIAPLPTIQTSPDVLLFSGGQINLQTTTSANVKSVSWTPTVGLNCYNCRTPTVVDARTTTYVATAVTEYGCMAKDSVRVTVACDGSPFYVANTFTPNGDGRDDWFYPQGTGIVRINRMMVQNRWGETVFQRENFSSNQPESGWDGSYKGQPLTSGTFMYLIEAICDSGEQLILKGDINLIR